jgi:prephenate dehydratase
MIETVCYPGCEGAHSAAAAAVMFPEATLEPLPNFNAVATAVEEREATFGVLPIENSLVGPIPETHDLLFADSSLSIVAQTVIPITHLLVGHEGAHVEDLRVVRSHPAALDQCRGLLARLSHVVPIAAATTGEAARRVAEQADPAEAAISSPRAARLYGLHVLESDVGDHSDAQTRFVALATYTRLDRNGGPFRTAFSFVTDHRPGALHRAMEPFARHAINLAQLVSRPIPRSDWRYRFDAILDGHVLDADVAAALAEARERTRQLRVFGSFPTVVAGADPDLAPRESNVASGV